MARNPSDMQLTLKNSSPFFCPSDCDYSPAFYVLNSSIRQYPGEIASNHVEVGIKTKIIMLFLMGDPKATHSVH